MASLMVDTDVLIDYLRDQPQAATFLESLDEPPCVSVVSVAENVKHYPLFDQAFAPYQKG